MNPYRPVVAEPAKANVWQARQRPTIGAVKGLMDRQQGGDPTSLAGCTMRPEWFPLRCRCT